MATNTIDFGKIYETTNFGNGVDDNTIDWGKVYKNLGGETKFVFSVQTDNSGSSNDDQFTLPLITSTDLDITVEWGDGNSDSISDHTASEVTHTYASAGEYTIKIDGTLRGFQFNDDGDKLKIKDVSNWGVMRFDVKSAFKGCANLTCTATDKVTVIGADLEFTFAECTNFNGAIGNWDVSNVTKMAAIFRGNSLFNQNIGNWDVSGVTSMNSMFRDTTNFNQDIGDWDVGNVTNMSSMFREATSFNQDIGSWDIESVTDFANFMLGVTLSTANYDALLIGWEAQNVTAGITINFGGSQYSAGAAATARQSLIDAPNNWDITDGGQA